MATAETTSTINQKQTNANVIELEVSPSQEHDKTKPDDTTVKALQNILTKQPTIADLLNKKTTWKAYLSINNILRVYLATCIAILIFLTEFILAYALNPNTCTIERTKPHHLQWNPFAHVILLSYKLCLTGIAVIKMLGSEWEWTSKRMNGTILFGITLVFCIYIPYGFLLNMNFEIYFFSSVFIGFVVALIAILIADGFYIFWLCFPIIIVSIIIFTIFGAANYVYLSGIITPESPFFSISYNIVLTVIQIVILTWKPFTIPYKWKLFCTCPCNKNKQRRTAKTYKDENSVVTVENEISELLLYYIAMIIISFLESMRLSGLLLLKNDYAELAEYIVYSVFFETISRNNLIWEFIYRCILKKPNPARSKLTKVFYGARYHAEYLPIHMIVLINIFKYGPQTECGRVRNSTLTENVSIPFRNWWLYFAMFGAELLSDVCAEGVLIIGRYCKWFGVKNDKGEDPPRATTLVKAKFTTMIWILLHCYVISFEAVLIDNSWRKQ
eukprot:146370_1